MQHFNIHIFKTWYSKSKGSTDGQYSKTQDSNIQELNIKKFNNQDIKAQNSQFQHCTFQTSRFGTSKFRNAIIQHSRIQNSKPQKPIFNNSEIQHPRFQNPGIGHWKCQFQGFIIQDFTKQKIIRVPAWLDARVWWSHIPRALKLCYGSSWFKSGRSCFCLFL